MNIMKLTSLLLVFFSLHLTAQNSILIKNANVWDGISNQINDNTSVLIEGNLIVEVSRQINAPINATIIDAKGKTLIPGLTDVHVHLALTMGMSEIRNNADWMYTAVKAGKSAENFLMLGFTTVRDLGGPAFGIKRAVDEGLSPGPRIYPSGAFISQTSGHGDSRNRNEPSMYWSGAPMHPIDAL